MDAWGSSWPASTAGEDCGAEPAGCPASAPRARKSERITVEFGAGLRQRGASGVSVHVRDLSTDGFRVATHLQLENGTDVWLRLPGLEPIHAKVKWSEGHQVGCAFERALHPAVLEMLVRKAGGA